MCTADKVFDALKDAANKAGWECDIDDDRGSVALTKEMPIGDDYDFVILYDTYDEEMLMDQILEGIDDEAINTSSTDFAMELEDSGLSIDDGSAYKYANKLTSALHTLGSRIADEFEMLQFADTEIEETSIEEPDELSSLDDLLDDVENSYDPDNGTTKELEEAIR